MITRALLAQSHPFRSLLRFNSLEQRLGGLRPIKVIEARYIEGCSYRNNITVSQARTPYEAYWLKRIHLSLLFSSIFWLNFDYEMLIAESTNLHSNNTAAGQCLLLSYRICESFDILY
jgi:hypothetical protein